jgi:hypothetical protein
MHRDRSRYVAGVQGCFWWLTGVMGAAWQAGTEEENLADSGVSCR